MTGGRNLRLVVAAFLAAMGTLVAFLCIPNLRDAELLGFRGYYEDGRLWVSNVYEGTPAESAGLRTGDSISEQDGRSVEDWHAAYRDDRDLYFEQRGEGESVVSYEVDRGGRGVTLRVMPRGLGLSDVVRLYGVRLALTALLVCLMVVILRSRTRERSTFLITLTFGFASLWLISDIPDLWESFSAVRSDASETTIALGKLLEVVFLQLAVALLFHVALEFPARHSLLKRYPWLLWVNYAGPLVILSLIAAAGSGGILNRLAAIHDSRLWINTALVTAAAATMLSNYRTLPSPAERERIRWIVVSLALFVGFHIALWNVPKMIVGHPLVPDYEWVVLAMALVPLTMTMSIINHELFGIRGIIRGRIRLLQTLLAREKTMVVNRDDRIREMTQELVELNNVLEQYRHSELADSNDQGSRPPSRLEKRYPEIRDIRRERLLGASPKWERILERAVIAARGATPVMIVGESGTGKTDVAWTLYRLGDRRDGDYREISCAQFEHADPAFALGRLFGIGTGHGLPNAPKERRPGLLEECDGGTLFLDDFDRLPLSVQDMLLYPFEGRPFEPGIGVGPARTVSIKFILATNQDPDRLVKEGSFRGDVLARIGERIDMPPLRERREDIPVLVEHLLGRVCRELGHEITIVSPMAMNLLARYPYDSGNARELQTELRAAAGKAMLEGDKVLRAGYLSERLRSELPARSERHQVPGEAAERSVETGNTLAALRRHGFHLKAAEAELGYSHKSKTLSNHLRGLCLEALSGHDWNPQRAARSLAADQPPQVLANLQRKIERYTKNIEANVAQGTEERLYRNLPAAYHDALRKTIEHLRRSSVA